MKEKYIKILHTAYGIVLSLLIVAFGLLLAGCCIFINSGADTGAFTLQSVLISLLVLFMPFIICVNAIIGGGILHAVCPREEKITSNISDRVVLKNLYKRVDLRSSPKYLVKVVKSQRSFRHVLLAVVIANILVNLAGAVITLFFSGIFQNVDPERIGSVIPAILSVLVYTILPFLSIIIFKVFANFTYERELEAVQEIVKHNTKNKIVVSKKQASEGKKKALRIVKRVLIICLQVFIVLSAIALIVLGIVFGDLEAILSIAHNLCKGCVGIG